MDQAFHHFFVDRGRWEGTRRSTTGTHLEVHFYFWCSLLWHTPLFVSTVHTGRKKLQAKHQTYICKCVAHPEKPTPSGFRAKNYKIRLGWNVLIPLNPKFQVDWSTTSWDIHHWFGSRNFVFVLILHLILLFFSSNFTRSGSVSSLGLPQSAYLVLLH